MSTGHDPREGVSPGVGRGACRVGGVLGFYSVCALLAGFGMQVLVKGLPTGIGYLVTGVLVVGAILEALHPRLALASFGRAIAFEPRLARHASLRTSGTPTRTVRV